MPKTRAKWKLDIRLEPNQVKLLDEVGELLGLTRSELIRTAVEELVEFFRIVKSGYTRNQEELRDIIRVFLASRRSRFVLLEDYRAITDEVKSRFSRTLLRIFEEEKMKREVNNKDG